MPNEEDGLPDMPKKTSSSSSGLPDMPVKKKAENIPIPLNEQSISNAPSVLEGGISGLDTGVSELPNITVKPGSNFDPFSKQPTLIDQKTALGNRVSVNKISPVTTGTGGTSISQNQQLNNDAKIKDDHDTKTLVDSYDAIKSTHGPDDKLNTADFYLENLKRTNPEEYNYTIDKQQTLSEEGDPLKIQEYHADLMKKSVLLKNKVMAGKLDLVTNNINDNYKPILEDFDKTSKEAEGLVNQIQGIDNFIKQNYQVDENGQIITNATNRKVVEDMLKKREDFVGQMTSNKEKLDEYSNNQDLKDALTQLDDVQKEYDSTAKLYKGLSEKDPNFYKGLPEVKKQIEKEQQAQFSKDLNEKMTGGDLGIMEGTGRGATSIVKNLFYVIKDKLGDDDKYGWTDESYDNVKGLVDRIDAEYNPLPTGYDKPMYEDGKWNLQYLPGKLAQTVTEMAPMVATTAGFGATAGLLARGAASGELSMALGSFTGEYITVAGNYYDQARDAGMGDQEAQAFAQSTAIAQAMISMLSPDLKLLKSHKTSLDDYTKMIAQGVSKKDAAKEVGKKIINNMLTEVPQENLQTWKEIQDQNAMYESMGLNDKVKKSIINDMAETTAVSIILSMGLGGLGGKSRSRLENETALMVASQPDLILERGKKMLDKGVITQKQFDDLSLKTAKASEALQKIDKNLPSETKAEVLPVMMEKNDLKAEKQIVDDSQHDIINEKIKNKDEEIKNILESPSKEQIEHDDFLKGFDSAIAVDEKKPVEIPKSENEMQLDGLVELDDSEKSIPRELSIEPETPTTEKENNEQKIALLEQARKDLKVNEFFQEKIDYKEFSKRDAAIEKEINALKKPVAIEQEKLAETVSENPSEDVSENKSPAQETQEDNVTPQSEDQGVLPKKDELIDEEEDAENKIKDDQTVLKKMQDDLEVLKAFSPNNSKMDSKSDDEIKNLATKKYQGMIERAYKAKLDGKINRSTYTIFRNAAGDILGPKIAEKNREVKGQIDAIRDKIKEKLLGEGYKNVLLSAPGINPKTVADFIDLTADLVKRGVDAGHEVRKVVDKALDYVKSHKNYADALKGENISDAKFRKLFESKISEIESIVEEPTQLEEKPVAEETTKDEKVTESVTENTSKSNKKNETVVDKPDVGTGEKKSMKHFDRIKNNPKYKELIASMDSESGVQDSTSIKKVSDYASSLISDYNKENTLPDLAIELINNDKLLHNDVQEAVMAKLVEKLYEMSDDVKLNSFEKSELVNLAAKLKESLMKNISNSAKKTVIGGRISKSIFEDVSASVSQTTANVNQKVKTVQDEKLSKKEKSVLEDSDKEVNSEIDSPKFMEAVKKAAEEQVNKIREDWMGKEKSSKFANLMKSLKIDLKDC